ncbi:TonB-dependent receptor [Polynucleobacter sp. JS-Safj-400b-B2]|uniref:TonB-dependent receptor domain-containing protein n=1 Tax=Polynucleobacter sp. JS-Safj-400b-B2 TaxID=2576921 RepID=UPI001C0AB1EA|nr:TonB-dependent receptor [Polynucleobacter sp. JS-Safj-400b-B2]MBU3625976.1 TonB-dependent receptor [Polynucleobacter sp. JS-Safj-400b-B2]
MNQIHKKSLAKSFALLLPILFSAHTYCQASDVNPLVVTATGYKQPLSDVLPSVTVVTREQIEKSQAPSIADLLQGEPGLEFHRTGGPGQVTTFNLRGNNGTNLVIYVDGVRSQVDGFGNLTVLNIPPNTVERIEILRGNAGALYGDAAIGGVINIFTRQGGNTDPKAYASVSVGSYNTQEAMVGYGGAINETKFNLTFDEMTSKGIPTLNAAQYPNVNPNTGAISSQTINASLSQKITKDFELGGGARYFTSNANYADPNAGPTSAGGDGATSSNTWNLKNISTDIGGFAKYNVNENWTTRFDIAQSQLQNQYYSNVNAVEFVANNGYNPNYSTQNIQTSTKWLNSYELDKDKIIIAGVDYTQAGYDDGQGNSSLSQNDQGYFLGYTQQYDALDIQINGRHDYSTVKEQNTGFTNQTYKVNTGLFGLGYHITEEFKLTGTISTAFQAPTAGQIFGYSYGGGSTFNAGLVPQTSYTNELGAVYQKSEFLSRLVYFNSRTMNAIQGQQVPNGFEFFNISQLRNNGYEFSQRANVYGVKVNAAYTNQNPVDLSTGQTPPLIARQFGSVDLNKAINEKFDIGTKVYFSGARQSTFYAPMNGPSTAVTLSNYQVWSFYAGMKITDELSVRVRLNNAFNEQYQLVSGYNTMGRNVMFTIAYQQK